MKRSLRFIVIGLLLVLVMVGCAPIDDKPNSYEMSATANEESVKNLIQNDDVPKVTKSLERENIKRRIEFINQPDRIGYLYLLSENGQLIKEVQVLGKVSSLNSYLTPMEDIQVVTNSGRVMSTNEYFNNRGSLATINSVITTQAADLDGTYGENATGIFWFTPDGVYQEWNGLYFYSSERLTFTTQPLLIETVTN